MLDVQFGLKLLTGAYPIRRRHGCKRTYTRTVSLSDAPNADPLVVSDISLML
jgi:hypothetical protein